MFVLIGLELVVTECTFDCMSSNLDSVELDSVELERSICSLSNATGRQSTSIFLSSQGKTETDLGVVVLRSVALFCCVR